MAKSRFNPSQHPRDSEGKFTERGGGLTRGTQRRLSVSSDENAGIPDSRQDEWMQESRTARVIAPTNLRDAGRAIINRPQTDQDRRRRREMFPKPAGATSRSDWGKFGSEKGYDRVAEKAEKGRATPAELREMKRLQEIWVRA